MQLALGKHLILFIFILLSTMSLASRLGSKTSYAMRRMLPNAPSLYSLQSKDPDGYTPSYIWLLSRHGTRWPTRKKLLAINNLNPSLFSHSELAPDHWVKQWRSPVEDKDSVAGRLHPMGVNELYSLGARLRSRFPSLINVTALENIPLIATAVKRTSESALAFAEGFLPRQPTSIIMAPKDNDPLLRPFDMNSEYISYEETMKARLKAWKSLYWSQLTEKVRDRLKLNRSMSPWEIDGLWQLLLVEGGLENDFKSASIFDSEDLSQLEWLEDVDLYVRRGPYNSLTYQIFEPLLQDLVRSLQVAASDDFVGPRMRLLFAHCETLVPFASLLNLFGHEESEGTKLCNSGDGDLYDTLFSASVPIQEDRLWRSSAISPYGSNLIVILYRRENTSDFLIRLCYNEQLIEVDTSLSGFIQRLQSRVSNSQK